MNLEALAASKQTALTSEKDLVNIKFALVEFYSPWHDATYLKNPVVKEIQTKYKDRIKVFRVEVEQQKSLAQKFKVTKTPHFQIFNFGKRIDQVEGILYKKVLLNKIKILMRNYS
ncbi:MAG: thioredoxin family protein [Bacteroidetes bacterium]|nr:thioredoxin family protein [Bacteroidota bacterium]